MGVLSLHMYFVRASSPSGTGDAKASVCRASTGHFTCTCTLGVCQGSREFGGKPFPGAFCAPGCALHSFQLWSPFKPLCKLTLCYR